jgi:hypothetical protein
VTRTPGLLLGALLLSFSFAAEIGAAQSYPGPPPPTGRGPFGRHPISRADDEAQNSNPPQAVKANAAQLERERYLELKKETIELARMANELQVAVAESNEHTLSLELAKKADRVEKLSKRIRDRIKRGY